MRAQYKPPDQRELVLAGGGLQLVVDFDTMYIHEKRKMVRETSRNEARPVLLKVFFGHESCVGRIGQLPPIEV